MNTSPNCLSYWFPRLQETGVPVPQTEIVHTDVDLIECLDGREPKGVVGFLRELHDAIDTIGLPCFLRSGHTSAKHEWASTCYLTDADNIFSQVIAIIEYGECQSIIGPPTDVWVVRELLPLEPAFTAFGGMPITKEFRFFIEDGAIICRHGYWPEGALEDNCDEPDWKAKLARNNYLSLPDAEILNSLTHQVAKQFEGAWSLDWLWTKQGWFAIDMARAETSWHWPDCPQDRWTKR